MIRLKTGLSGLFPVRKEVYLTQKPTEATTKMVISVKPLPGDSDAYAPLKTHQLKAKTEGNAEFFWNNYCQLQPIFEVKRLLYLGKWTFLEVDCMGDALDGCWTSVGHKAFEGKAWSKLRLEVRKGT